MKVFVCDDEGVAGVVEDLEGWVAGGWGKGGRDEGDKMLGEEDVAAAAALGVGLGHVAGKRAAGEVGIVVGVVVVRFRGFV